MAKKLGNNFMGLHFCDRVNATPDEWLRIEQVAADCDATDFYRMRQLLGMTWDYAGEPYISAMDAAAIDFGDRLAEFVDARITTMLSERTK